MPRGSMVYFIGTVSLIPALVTAVITAVRCSLLADRSLPESVPSEWASLAFSVCSCIVICILSGRLVCESQPTSYEWKVGAIRVRTLICAFLFISMAVVAGGMAKTSFHGDGAVTAERYGPFKVLQIVMWTISAYFQGALCGLSFILSNIRNSHKRRSLSGSGGVPMALDVNPTAFNFWTHHHQKSTETVVNPIPPSSPDPSVARARTIRPVVSIDGMLLQPLPSPLSPWYTSHHNQASTLSFESVSISKEDNNNVHPLFRPDSPTPPPTRSSGTSIVAAPAAGRTLSLDELKSRRVSGFSHQGTDHPLSAEAKVNDTSAGSKLVVERSRNPDVKSVLPRFIWEASQRHSFLRFKKRQL